MSFSPPCHLAVSYYHMKGEKLVAKARKRRVCVEPSPQRRARESRPAPAEHVPAWAPQAGKAKASASPRLSKKQTLPTSSAPQWVRLCLCPSVAKSCPTLLESIDYPARLLWPRNFPGKNTSGLPFPTPADLPDPGIEPASLLSPALAGKFFAAELTGKP